MQVQGSSSGKFSGDTFQSSKVIWGIEEEEKKILKCSSRILFLIRPNVFVSFIRPGLQGIQSSTEKSVYMPVVFTVLGEQHRERNIWIMVLYGVETFGEFWT